MNENERLNAQVAFIRSFNELSDAEWKNRPVVAMCIDPETMNVVSSEKVQSAHESALITSTFPKVMLTLLMKHNGLPLDMAIGALMSAVESTGRELEAEIRKREALAMMAGGQA